MKWIRIIAVLLLAAVLLTGCAAQEKQEAAKPAPKALQEVIQAALPDAGDLAPLTAEDLSDVLGIEAEDYTEFVFLTDDGMGGREALALRAKNEDALGRVKARMEKYLEQRQKETQNYLPEAYKYLADARVETKGLTAVLVTGEKAAEQMKAILAGE